MLEPEDIDACRLFTIALMDRKYIIKDIKQAA